MQSIKDSLRVKITLGVTLPLVIIMGIFAVIEDNRNQEVVLRHLTSVSSRTTETIRNSLRYAMQASDFPGVQTVLNSMNETEGFRVIYLLNTDGEVIFGPDGSGVGTRLDKTQPACQSCHRLEPGARPGSVIVEAEDGERVFRSMYPINNSPECSGCHDPSRKILGLLLTDIPADRLLNSIASDFREHLFWWAGAIVLIALAANLSMNSLVIKRLEHLAQAFRNVGTGEQDILLDDGASDEISRLGRSFNEMADRIDFENAENMRLSSHRSELLRGLITAQEDERKRVARELHDNLGQSLSALSLHVQSLETLISSDPDGAIRKMNQIRDLIEETSDGMYELILALRPSELDEFGLVAALRKHAEKILDGSEMEFTLDSSRFSGRLSPDLETALYRVFQEALSNIRRHAQARHVIITLELREHLFKGEIMDDGSGFDPRSIESNGRDARGLGLLSITERIAQYGGQVDISSRPGAGTTITIQIPAIEINHDR